MGVPGKVGVVFVSHSAQIAAGLVELAAQMAPTTALIAAGGTDDGRIGTSFDLVNAGIAEADSGAGVVVLCDLGSAILTAETVLDFLDETVRERVRIVDAPIVEGGVAAAVAAESGDGLDSVVAAARAAGATADAAGGRAEASDPLVEPSPPLAEAGPTRTVRLINPDGLHARPAAELVKLASTFSSRVTVNGVDAKSLLAIMALGLTRGAEVVVAGEDADSAPAVDAIAALAASGFGEA